MLGAAIYTPGSRYKMHTHFKMEKKTRKKASDTAGNRAIPDVDRQPKINDDSSNENGQDQTAVLSGPPTNLQINRKASRRAETTKRMKWSREMNLNVIRTYLLVNECRDDPLPGWRQKLHSEFLKRYPDINVTEQNLVDRKRTIIRNNYLTQTDIDQLRRDVGNELNLMNEVAEYQNLDVTETDTTRQSLPSQNNPTDEEEEVTQKLLSNFELFRGSDPSNRPSIPKLKFNNLTSRYITNANFSLQSNLHRFENLTDIHTAIYATAVTVIELNGQKILERTSIPPKPTKVKPSWQRRLESDINTLRTRNNIIREYLNNNNSKKVKIKIEVIIRTAKLNKQDPEFREKLITYQDELRQKLQVKGARLRRYNEASKRKQQNRNFQANQRAFYRNFDTTNRISSEEHVDQQRFEKYWQDIWSNPTHFNQQAPWIDQVEESTNDYQEMVDIQIEENDIKSCIVKTSNWKATGLDKIHNFWLKHLTCIHSLLAKFFTNVLRDPDEFPEFLAQGITYLLPKKGDMKDPKNYRPITCLSVFYKLLTAIVHKKIYEHCQLNNLIAVEQKGCIKNSLGCKEQLTIDAIIMKQAETKCRNLSMGYIDYRKAFDSVPHDWLLKVLELYKINPNIITFLSHIMKKWKSQILLNNRYMTTINIRKGIFQGDSLSPLWFCLALNPLSHLLNQCKSGYRPDLKDSINISHLLFMDDIKLYSESNNNLKYLLKTVQIFSDDIRMDFGMDKCAEIHIRKGKIAELPNEEVLFHQLTPDESYHYLGIQQNKRIDHTRLKKEFKIKYKSRLTKLLNTKLNAKNLITAINTYAVPILTYSFGILKYSDTDLRNLDILTRTTFTKFRIHHPKSATQRLYLPRKEGGRGLTNITELCRSQEKKMREYFHCSNHPLLRKIAKCDTNFTPLNLHCPEDIIDDHRRKEEMHLEWQNKVLHGKYPTALNDPTVEKASSLLWLTKGNLHAETEGFIISVQDGVIRTRNYERYILKNTEIVDVCRVCHSFGETIEHVIGGCSGLSNSAYLGRHNQIAKIIHRQLAIQYRLIDNPPPYYKYLPAAVLESDNTVLYWDRPIITDRTVDYNRPDIVIIDKANKNAILVDIACPLSANLQKTEREKIAKYQNLSVEIKHAWKLKEVRIIPIVISSTGIVSRCFAGNLERLALPNGLIVTIQSAAILQTCHIVRKFLSI